MQRMALMLKERAQIGMADEILLASELDKDRLDIISETGLK